MGQRVFYGLRWLSICIQTSEWGGKERRSQRKPVRVKPVWNTTWTWIPEQKREIIAFLSILYYPLISVHVIDVGAANQSQASEHVIDVHQAEIRKRINIYWTSESSFFSHLFVTVEYFSLENTLLCGGYCQRNHAYGAWACNLEKGLLYKFIEFLPFLVIMPLRYSMSQGRQLKRYCPFTSKCSTTQRTITVHGNDGVQGNECQKLLCCNLQRILLGVRN